MAAPDPSAVRLARASWDAATPGSRTFLFLRSRYSARSAGIDPGELGIPFLSWDELPAEICHELAWDVQFLSRVLRDGQAALRAASPVLVTSGGVAA